MFFNSIKEINRLRKEINTLRKQINRLLSKEMSNIYLKVSVKTFSKLQFSKFKKFVTRSVFGELQLTQILNVKTYCCNFFYYFNFERDYDVSKSTNPCILLHKNINFNKNETKPKMENPTHSFRETNLTLQIR